MAEAYRSGVTDSHAVQAAWGSPAQVLAVSWALFLIYPEEQVEVEGCGWPGTREDPTWAAGGAAGALACSEFEPWCLCGAGTQLREGEVGETRKAGWQRNAAGPGRPAMETEREVDAHC